MTRILIPLSLTIILLPSLLISCDKTESVEKEPHVSAKTAIPLVDTYIPLEIETATFALG